MPCRRATPSRSSSATCRTFRGDADASPLPQHAERHRSHHRRTGPYPDEAGDRHRSAPGGPARTGVGPNNAGSAVIDPRLTAAVIPTSVLAAVVELGQRHGCAIDRWLAGTGLAPHRLVDPQAHRVPHGPPCQLPLPDQPDPRFRVAAILTISISYSSACPSGDTLPSSRPEQQSLHRIGAVMPGLFGRLPAGLDLQIGQQPRDEPGRGATRLHLGEPRNCRSPHPPPPPTGRVHTAVSGHRKIRRFVHSRLKITRWPPCSRQLQPRSRMAAAVLGKVFTKLDISSRRQLRDSVLDFAPE